MVGQQFDRVLNGALGRLPGCGRTAGDGDSLISARDGSGGIKRGFLPARACGAEAPVSEEWPAMSRQQTTLPMITAADTEALQVVRTIGDDSRRSYALRELAPTLPESLLASNFDNCITIPMHGTRSLNLATAAAIVLFEAVRQQR